MRAGSFKRLLGSVLMSAQLTLHELNQFAERADSYEIRIWEIHLKLLLGGHYEFSHGERVELLRSKVLDRLIFGPQTGQVQPQLIREEVTKFGRDGRLSWSEQPSPKIVGREWLAPREPALHEPQVALGVQPEGACEQKTHSEYR